MSIDTFEAAFFAAAYQPTYDCIESGLPSRLLDIPGHPEAQLRLWDIGGMEVGVLESIYQAMVAAGSDRVAFAHAVKPLLDTWEAQSATITALPADVHIGGDGQALRASGVGPFGPALLATNLGGI